MKDIIRKLNQEASKYTEEEKPLYHINCAENLLMAAGEKYQLGVDDKLLRAICPFGAGMQCEKTCGALVGSVAAIGLKYTEMKPSSNEKVKNVTESFVKQFEAEFGGTDCAYLKEHFRSETEGCNPLKIRIGELLEKVLEDNK